MASGTKKPKGAKPKSVILYIRVPESMHDTLSAVAAKRGQTLAGAIRFILARAMKAQAA